MIVVVFVRQLFKQGWKRPLDTSKRMIERKEKEGERERKKGKRRDIEREGEIREREVKGIERVKGAQSKPNPSPNVFPKLCEWFSGRFLLKGRGTRTVPSLRGKSSSNLPNREIKRKIITKIISRNYYWKLWASISITRKMWDL